MSARRPFEEVREAIFLDSVKETKLQHGTERFLGPRVAEGQHLQQSVLCWWRCVLGETKATNYPPSPSQGQGWWVWRETSCCSLDLRGCASLFFCPGGSASARYTQSDPHLNSGSEGAKKETLMQSNRGSHGIALSPIWRETEGASIYLKKKSQLCLALRNSLRIAGKQTNNIDDQCLSSRPLKVTHQNTCYSFVLFYFL